MFASISCHSFFIFSAQTYDILDPSYPESPDMGTFMFMDLNECSRMFKTVVWVGKLHLHILIILFLFIKTTNQNPISSIRHG